MINISVMGSTGSIGTQTLDIVRRFPDRFHTVALTACSNWQLLAEQALEFRPEVAVIADPVYYSRLEEALKGSGIQPLCGEEALEYAATLPDTQVVVGALVGFSGLKSTIAALKAGKTMALANKETLVVGGEIINGLIENGAKPILPVDSEHSAIFQVLRGEDSSALRNIILTASGGPFRNTPLDELARVTVEQALAHPNWSMGAKVTIDSATMMNKGFEMMEARWLFNCPPEKIKILVHPQSVIHSMVEFRDGSVKAQLAIPDMHLPIGYALSFPERLPMPEYKAPDFATMAGLTFQEPDMRKFPLLAIAYETIKKGGLYPTVLNAANEVAVKAFLDRKIPFTGIVTVVEKTLETVDCSASLSLDSIYDTHREATRVAYSLS